MFDDAPSLIREGWGGFVVLTNPTALRPPPLIRGGMFDDAPSLIREGWGGFDGVDKPLRLSATSPCQGRSVWWCSLPVKGGLGWVCGVNKPHRPPGTSPCQGRMCLGWVWKLFFYFFVTNGHPQSYTILKDRNIAWFFIEFWSRKYAKNHDEFWTKIFNLSICVNFLLKKLGRNVICPCRSCRVETRRVGRLFIGLFRYRLVKKYMSTPIS